jgi:curved DNA-binding protein CbpA
MPKPYRSVGLPPDSDYDDVIRAFREHVKVNHPDYIKSKEI